MAIELARQDVPFRLIDKSEQGAQWSQALGVQARTLEQFERYGIAEKAVAAGLPIRHAAFFHDGKRLAEAPLDRIPGNYPYVLLLPQVETERILTERLHSAGGEIERRVELTSFTNGDDCVNAEVRHEDGRAEIIHSRWLIGCDGAHSTVRQGLDVSFRGDTVGFSFFLADLTLDGPNVPQDELRVYLHGGDVLFIAPLRKGLWRLIVALHSEQNAPERQPQLSDFQAAIDRSAGGMTARDPTWMAPFRVNQRKAEHYRMQNAFLAGDACHIHSPVGGQGMNTGIQDAANLGWKLRAVSRGADAKLLDSYDQERGAVGDALLRTTSRGLAAATLSNPIAEALRDAAIAVGSRIPLLRDAVAGWVSETAISYNESPIVVDCGDRADLIAGDRMPNANLSGGGRLLDGLRDGKHLGIGAGVPEADRKEMEAKLPRACWIWVDPREMPHTGLDNSGQIFVVRPDGYIGFRGGIGDGGELGRYGKLAAL
jgi:2-polyprenyl-6-methoxyphenol hydroxylase-like FAD-dependent oxidoreductase